MKFTPQPILYATYTAVQTLNIKNTSTVTTADLTLTTHLASSVWTRTIPSVPTPAPRNVLVATTLPVRSIRRVFDTNLSTVHVRFNRNRTPGLICRTTQLSLSFIKFDLKGYIWLSEIIRSLAYTHAMFGLLHLLTFPLLQTLTKNSTRFRRPLTKTLKHENNILVNL